MKPIIYPLGKSPVKLTAHESQTLRETLSGHERRMQDPDIAAWYTRQEENKRANAETRRKHNQTLKELNPQDWEHKRKQRAANRKSNRALKDRVIQNLPGTLAARQFERERARNRVKAAIRYKLHPQTIQDANRAYRKANPEVLKQWKEENKEKLEQYQKDWIAKNRSKWNEYQRRYQAQRRAANPQAAREAATKATAKWRAAHREQWNAYNRTYQAKRRAAKRLTFSYENTL